MSRIFISKQLVLLTIFFNIYPMAIYAKKGKPALIKELSILFSHKKHAESFSDMKISCKDCHNFSIKPTEKGPLGALIEDPAIKPARQLCHQCHQGKVMVPTPNRCTLCHLPSKDLKPDDHFISWKNRHGQMAQMDSDSCKNCHSKNDCSDCHLQRNGHSVRVHRGGFRFTHSMEARLNPNKCTTCHQSTGFCLDCHMGKN